jgi:iron-sulfur cluster insertion protein
MITLTEKAVEKLKEIAESEAIGHTSIRVKIKGGGCAGFMHDMNFDDIKSETDEVVEQDGVVVLVDPLSYQYLENVTIDWEDHLISAGFRFKSPDITSSCGCGHSVDYK